MCHPPRHWSLHTVRPARGLGRSARALKLEVEIAEAATPSALDAAFAAIKLRRVGAVLVLADAILGSEAPRISSFCVSNGLPAMYGLKEDVSDGALLSYGPSLTDLFYRAAAYVDKILRGAKPSDLPVEQATGFELMINLETAKALGLTIPPSLLLRADQVIE